MPGGITGLPCSWGNKYGNLSLHFGTFSKIETIKYSHEACGLRLEKPALVTSSKDWKIQTRLFVGEGAPHHLILNCLKKIKERRRRNWSWVQDGCLSPIQTGRLTFGRNITWLNRDQFGSWQLKPVVGRNNSSRRVRFKCVLYLDRVLIIGGHRKLLQVIVNCRVYNWSK
jgi:hypothetical protein